MASRTSPAGLSLSVPMIVALPSIRNLRTCVSVALPPCVALRCSTTAVMRYLAAESQKGSLLLSPVLAIQVCANTIASSALVMCASGL